MPYPIFPSITRAPKYESTRKLEDDTIADPMESGYVATRPRFTRRRRTFGVSYKNICGEDLRVLDQFEVVTVLGKAGAFWYPNLLPNASFENPTDTGRGVSGWSVSPSPVWLIGQSAVAADGLVAMAFTTSAAAPSTPAVAQMVAASTPPVMVGDAYQVTASAQIASQYTGATVALNFLATILYGDESEAAVVVPLLSVNSSAYQVVTGAFTIPAAASGSPAVMMQLAFQVSLALGANDGGSPSGTNAATVLLDAVGLALTSAAQPYGRMPGSAPIGSLVRFTKQPALKDNTFAGGQPTYDCMFEVTEV